MNGAEREVRDLIDQMIAAQNAGDMERYSSTLSDRSGSTFIGTDPDEWWTKEELVGALAGISTPGDITVVHDEPSIHFVGDVAWVEGRIRFVNRSGGEHPARVTGVIVREGGKWAVTQMHASLGVPNSELFG
jgi:hypothetical protein